MTDKRCEWFCEIDVTEKELVIPNDSQELPIISETLLGKKSKTPTQVKVMMGREHHIDNKTIHYVYLLLSEKQRAEWVKRMIFKGYDVKCENISVEGTEQAEKIFVDSDTCINRAWSVKQDPSKNLDNRNKFQLQYNKLYPNDDKETQRTQILLQKYIVKSRPPGLYLRDRLVVKYDDIESLNDDRTNKKDKYWSEYKGDIEETVGDLLPLLNEERFINNNYWIEIGKALYNVEYSLRQKYAQEKIKYTKEDFNGLEIWKFATGKIDQDKVKCCAKYYKSQDFKTKNGITIKTIAWYAKDDDLKGYLNWHKKWCENELKASLKGNEIIKQGNTKIAKFLYKTYWLDIDFKSGKHPDLYIYCNNKWELNTDYENLKRLISDDFKNKYIDYRTELSIQLLKDPEPNNNISLNNSIGAIVNILNFITLNKYIDDLIKLSIQFFRSNIFEIYLDDNDKLIGVKNGVIDLTGQSPLFREGKPEDYISKCTKTEYNEELDWEDENVVTCMKWFKQIFIDDDLVEYYLSLSSSFLKGTNTNKVFMVFSGNGNNSKSMLKILYEESLGDYSYTFPTTILTGKRTGSGSATPDTAGAEGARICFLQEPDGSDTFNEGMLKELSGGDKMYVRALYGKAKNIPIKFSLVLMCNDIPMINNPGKALKNRLRILPFLSEWVDDAPESEEEQFKQRKFKINKSFRYEINNLTEAFLWILVQKYKEYKCELSKEPQIVTEKTKEYWEDVDFYQQYINNYLIKDKDASLTFEELQSDFTLWCKDLKRKVPKSHILKKIFIEKIGKLDKNNGIESWSGMRIKIGDSNANSNNDGLSNNRVIDRGLVNC